MSETTIPTHMLATFLYRSCIADAACLAVQAEHHFEHAHFRLAIKATLAETRAISNAIGWASLCKR